jgi:hypothetical protein
MALQSLLASCRFPPERRSFLAVAKKFTTSNGGAKQNHLVRTNPNRICAVSFSQSLRLANPRLAVGCAGSDFIARRPARVWACLVIRRAKGASKSHKTGSCILQTGSPLEYALAKNRGGGTGTKKADPSVAAATS